MPDDSCAELVGVLQEQGFEPFETDLPGGWATDGKWTVIVDTKQTTSPDPAKLHHTVLVYDYAPGAGILDAPAAGRATDTSTELAIRRAFDAAGYPAPEVPA